MPAAEEECVGIKTLIASGAGFIGSALVRHLALDQSIHVVNGDKLTHAGNLDSLRLDADNPKYALRSLGLSAFSPTSVG